MYLNNDEICFFSVDKGKIFKMLNLKKKKSFKMSLKN